MRWLSEKLPPYRRAAVIEALIVVGVLALLAGAVLALNFWLTDASRSERGAADIDRVKDVVSIVQAFFWAFLIVAGGIFAYRNLQMFRDFEPHLTVTQEATHRLVGARYTHISVTTTLHNRAKVRVEIRDAFCSIYQVQPIRDEEVERLYVEAHNYENHGYIEWPFLDQVNRKFDANDLVIEPGEQHHEVFGFIVSKDVESVMIYSYFYNTAFSERSRSAQGWTATTFSDMLSGKRSNQPEVNNAI